MRSREGGNHDRVIIPSSYTGDCHKTGFFSYNNPSAKCENPYVWLREPTIPSISDACKQNTTFWLDVMSFILQYLKQLPCFIRGHSLCILHFVEILTLYALTHNCVIRTSQNICLINTHTNLISLNVEMCKRSSLNSVAVAFRFLIIKHLLLTGFLQFFPYFLSLRLFTDIH